MTKQQVANPMLKDFPWDGNELVSPLTLPGALISPSYVEQKLIATPANPPAGSLRLYPKSDGKYYQLDSAGNETIISGLTQSQTDARYLPLTGGTLSGPLSVNAGFSAQSVTTAGVVTADSVVANTYKWTPASDGEVLSKDIPGRLRLSGAQLTIDQNLNVGTYTQFAEITTPLTPNTGQMKVYAKADHGIYARDNNGVENKLLYKTDTDSYYPQKTDIDPYPQYMTQAEGDARYSFIPPTDSGNYLTKTVADTLYLSLGGGTLTGLLTLSADPSTNLQAATKQYVDTKTAVITNYLPLTGGTLSGNLLFSPDATLDIGDLTHRVRDIWVGRRVPIGTTSQTLYWASWSDSTTSLNLYASAGSVMVASSANVSWHTNAWYDGTNWHAFNGSNPMYLWNAGAGMSFYSSPGSTPGTWTQQWNMDASGNQSPVKSSTGVFVDTGGQNNGTFGPSAPYYGLYLGGGPSATGEGMQSQRQTGGNNQYGLDFVTGWNIRMQVLNNGNVNVVNSLTVGGGMTLTGYLTINNGTTVNGRGAFVAASTGVASATASQGEIEAQASNGGAAMISYHRAGYFATYMGLDTDNVMRVGGWSNGAAAWRLILGDGYGNPGGITVTSGIIQMSNCDIQQVRTLYGMSNGCYFTSSGGDTWSCLNHLSIGYDLTVGRTLTATGGNSTFSYVISNGGFDCNGPLYFNHNGGISITNNNSQFIFSQPPISTNGYYYFVNTTVAFYWNGSGLQSSNGAIYSAGFVATGTGTYNFGDANVRISRPGNIMYFYAYDAQWAFIRTYDSFNCGYVDGGGFHNTSKRMYKKNITPIKDGLRRVLDTRLTPISYAIKGNGILPDKPSMGFTAEDMAEVVPEVVGRDDDGPASINYGSLVAVLWDAVRTLNNRIEQLEQGVAA